jgi:hypothetical protein
MNSSSSSLRPLGLHQILHRLRRLYTHTFLTQDINQERGRAIILACASRVHGLVILVTLYVLDVHVEEIGAVHWAAFGFGVELCGEDRAGFVDHAFEEPR